MYTTIINLVIEQVGFIIEYFGLGIVTVSVVIAIYRVVLPEYTVESVRRFLGKRIIFGLEFIIAADILLATVATDLNEVLRLFGIVFIRVVLGWGLRKEIGVK